MNSKIQTFMKYKLNRINRRWNNRLIWTFIIRKIDSNKRFKLSIGNLNIQFIDNEEKINSLNKEIIYLDKTYNILFINGKW
jgi:hypothetical protein